MIKKALVISFISFLFYSEAFAILARSTSFDDRVICEESKGVWRQFGNGCADNCESKFDEFSICTQALVFACDCGKNRCWNEGKCVTRSSYEEIYNVKKAEEKKVLDEAKEKRKAYAKANLEAIMLRLKSPAEGDNSGGMIVQNNNVNQVDYSKDRESSIKINDPNPVAPVAEKKDDKNNSKESKNKESKALVEIQPIDPEVQADIPPLYLQKQAKKQQENSDSSSSVIPPGLPEIELPN
jgi:hypothetical protein